MLGLHGRDGENGQTGDPGMTGRLDPQGEVLLMHQNDATHMEMYMSILVMAMGAYHLDNRVTFECVDQIPEAVSNTSTDTTESEKFLVEVL